MKFDTASDDTVWNSLYYVGGVSAVVMAVFIPIQVIVFILSPPPDTVIGWFTLFQKSQLLGLLDMDLLLIVDQVLVGLILLALYAMLKRVNQSLMTIALSFAMLGIAAYFASATAFNMLSLSNQYAAATTETQKAIILAAGETMLSLWQGTAFDVGYVLEGLALLIVAVVMQQSTYFGRVTVYAAIVLGVMSLIPPTTGTIGMIFALGSLVPLEIWSILIARKLFQMGRAA